MKVIINPDAPTSKKEDYFILVGLLAHKGYDINTQLRPMEPHIYLRLTTLTYNAINTTAENYLRSLVGELYPEAQPETTSPDHTKWQGLGPDFVNRLYAKPMGAPRASEGPVYIGQRAQIPTMLTPWNPKTAAKTRWGLYTADSVDDPWHGEE